MALIEYGIAINSIRGSIGGTTYGASSAGPIAKRKPNPVRRLRSVQSHNRSTMGWLARQWGTLAIGVQEAWGAWAQNHPFINKFGNPFVAQPMNAFQSINLVAMRLGELTDFIQDPPVAELVASLASFTATTGATLAGDVDLAWTHNGTPDSGDFVEIAKCGPFLGNGKRQTFNQKVFDQAVAGDEVDVTIGGLTELAYYHFFARYVGADGQKSAWFQASATPKVTV